MVFKNPRRTLGLNELESLRDVVFILDSRSGSGMTLGGGIERQNVELINVEFRGGGCRIGSNRLDLATQSRYAISFGACCPNMKH